MQTAIKQTFNMPMSNDYVAHSALNDHGMVVPAPYIRMGRRKRLRNR